MRSIISFDTLEYMDELKKAGMNNKEAEAITKATAKAFNQIMETREVSTRSDITSIKEEINQVKVELIKTIHDSTWKTIGMLATFQTIILGLFGLLQYAGK